MSGHVSSLSLVAQFDELCCCTKGVSNGSEEEFSEFVGSQLSLFRKWKEAEEENETLRKRFTDLFNNHNQCEHRIKHLRNTVAVEIKNRKELQEKNNILMQQIDAIRDILLSNGNTLNEEAKEKLFFLSNTASQIQADGNDRNRLRAINESIPSLLSPSNLDDTKNDSIGEGYRRRKRSSSSSECSPTKKNRSENVRVRFKGNLDSSEMDIDNKETETEAEAEFDTCVEFNSRINLSARSSEKPLSSKHSSDSAERKPSPTESEIRKSPRLSPSAVLTSTPQHAFDVKRVLKTEKCYICGPAKFSTQILKCSKCGLICHTKCQVRCPSECSSSSSKDVSGVISDYAPSTSPMVPSLVVQCINEIESRGLSDIGMYRQSGRRSHVTSLKEKLMKKNIQMEGSSIHTVCGVLKEFLKSLSDPLIPRSERRMFVNAAEENNENVSRDLLYQALCDLPQPNRDTLAYLIPHLQRVAASPKCKMPISNLANVFAPTIVGYPSPEPQMENMLVETSKSIQVMEKLLKIPLDSWQNISTSAHMKSPEITPAPFASRLGPIYASIKKVTNKTHQKSPLHTRNGRSNQQKSRFFTSPLLK